jgi:hypothetical protein
MEALLHGIEVPSRVQPPLPLDVTASDCAVFDALRSALPVSQVEPGPRIALIRFEPGTPLGVYLSRDTRAATAKAMAQAPPGPDSAVWARGSACDRPERPFRRCQPSRRRSLA